MKDETKRYGDEAYEIVNYAAKTVGSRLPGSDGEKIRWLHGWKTPRNRYRAEAGRVFVSPRSSIGGLSYAGWVGVILSGLTYIALQITSLWIGMALASVCAVIWLVFSCFFYKTWFDMFFHRNFSKHIRRACSRGRKIWLHNYSLRSYRHKLDMAPLWACTQI